MTTETWVQMFPGVRRRILADGENVMLVEVHLDAGAVVPRHAHVHEQISLVHRGKLKFEMDDRTFELGTGQAALMRSNEPHKVTALEASIAMDTFSPPRADFRNANPADAGIYK